ncbi:DUF378 domain-containing protein [Rubellimicrobium sp. CFH 75288]|uniref:DUF378 domain-containing protein n=1 Tax=Rubellimicrobium sp. CFH 75288 TaxID=2697034 RepID=UPI00141220FC|nr:DUF378 domain-containing protein [Rubellimicrobium sp. CFH 75288]NAZ37958.1 DUF378 domain-containing protein [Rubellimicrobium sp. CFH 75288]
MHILRLVSVILLIVGGLNWGLVGLFGFNLVGTIFGAVPLLERLVYVLVGAAAVVLLVMPDTWKRHPALA